MPQWLLPGIIFCNSLLALLFLYFGAVQIPVAGLLIWALLPLPFAALNRRQGLGSVLLLLLAGAGVIHYGERFFGLKAELLALAQMAVIGLTLAQTTARHCRLEVVIGGTALVAALAEVAVFWSESLLAGQAVLAQWQQHIHHNVGLLVGLLPTNETLAKDLPWAGLDQAELGRFIFRITPALLLINALGVALLNYAGLRVLGLVSGGPSADKPLLWWEIPQWLVFVLIGAGFLLLLPVPAGQTVGLNLILVLLPLYFLQGLAILAFGLQRLQVPRLFRWLTYLTLLLVKPAAIAVILLGLTDLWLDYRRLHRQPKAD